MKPRSRFLAVAALNLALCGPALAGSPPDSFAGRYSAEQLSRIEDNLLWCLASDSPGARAGAAHVLRRLKQAAPEYSFRRSVIPLMRILRDNECDELSRLAAVMALHELRTDRGDYAIKAAARFSEKGRFKRLCEHLVLVRSAERPDTP